MKDVLSRIFCGVLLGLSVVAPGVSGTIIAVSMGIYDRLIGILSNPFRGLRRNIVFLMPLGAGGIAGALGFLLIFKVIFDSAGTGGYMLFIGLVLGSMPVVLREMRAFRAGYALACVLAACAALAVSWLAQGAADSTAHPLAWLALCGAVAGAMSVIPGVSVSMTLMMLGVYRTLLDAVFAIDIAVICVVGACFAAGMVLASNVVKLAFDKARMLAFYMVFGFLSGSMLGVFIGLEHEAAGFVPSAAALVIGVALSLLSQRAGRALMRGKK